MTPSDWKALARIGWGMIAAVLLLTALVSVSTCTARETCAETCERRGLRKVITDATRGLCMCKDEEGNYSNEWSAQ